MKNMIKNSLVLKVKATGYLTTSTSISVHRGNVTNIKVVMSSVGHAVPTIELNSLVKGR